MTEIFDKEQTPIRLVDCVQLQLQDEEIKSTGWICPFCKKKQKKIKKQLKFRYGIPKYNLTLIREFLGPSPSAFSGKNQKHRL